LKKVRVFSKVFREENGRERKEGKQKQIEQGNVFVFCEKTSGVAQFRAGSFGASEASLDRVAGLFAMQCLVRGYDPNDFVVLVPAEKQVAAELVSRATDLLEEGRSVTGPTTLSPRQKEILQSVVCNHANKEIASKLNITVRTVKFHISSLLSKFGVDNRIELARRAAGVLRPAVLEPEAASASPTDASGAVGDEQVLDQAGVTTGSAALRLEPRREAAFSASSSRGKSFGSWRAAR
jgi:DNA-binding CsgD family transcriptional regulator